MIVEVERVVKSHASFLWAVAVFTKHTMDGFAHVLLVFALVFGLIYLVRGSNS